MNQTRHNQTRRIGLSLAIIVLSVFARQVGAAPPLQLTASEIETQDADREIVGGPYAGLLLVPHTGTASDGKYGQPYHAACYVYAGERASGSDPNSPPTAYLQRFAVHAPDGESLPLARRVGKMLLLLHGLNRERLRKEHPFGESVDVWLTRQGATNGGADAGGEQFKNQVYLYNIFQPRQPAEWAREVAHEYGHYILPGVSGFTAPEEWANGVLGERLFLTWLYDEAKAGRLKPEELPFVTPAELDDYMAKQVWPLLRRIARDGTEERAIMRRDAAGMDYYTGVALYLDTVYGSRALLDALAYSAPKEGQTFLTARDFLNGARESLKAAVSLTLTAPALSKEGRAETFMVFLPRGDWTISAENTRRWELPADAKGLYPKGKSRLLVTLSDWRKLKLVPSHMSATPRLTLRRADTEMQ